jgi:hypothetical protein
MTHLCLFRQLDLSENRLCAEGITAIADALRDNVGLTVANLLCNQLDAESAKMLAEVAKQKGISLCGIRRDQTTADFADSSFLNYKPPDAILLASDLSQAIVTGALTQVLALRPPECLSCYSNPCLVLNTSQLDLSSNGNELCGLDGLFGLDRRGRGTYTAEGITAIADALRVNGALTQVLAF